MDQALQQLNDAATAVMTAAAQAPDSVSCRSSGGSDRSFRLPTGDLRIGYFRGLRRRVGNPALHTPLMAVTNAISSVIVVGALLAVGISASGAPPVSASVALVFVLVSIVGGFVTPAHAGNVTRRRHGEAAC